MTIFVIVLPFLYGEITHDLTLAIRGHLLYNSLQQNSHGFLPHPLSKQTSVTEKICSFISHTETKESRLDRLHVPIAYSHAIARSRLYVFLLPKDFIYRANNEKSLSALKLIMSANHYLLFLFHSVFLQLTHPHSHSFICYTIPISGRWTKSMLSHR